VKSSNVDGIAHATFQCEDPNPTERGLCSSTGPAAGIPFIHGRFATNNYATEGGISIQMAGSAATAVLFDGNRVNADLIFGGRRTTFERQYGRRGLQNFEDADGLAGLMGIPAR